MVYKQWKGWITYFELDYKMILESGYKAIFRHKNNR